MVRLLALIALFVLGAGAAEAATVIYYSDDGEYYGWAAGYGYDRAASEARSYCTSAGGSNCLQVLSCDGGWGSIAFADDSAKGVGMVCGFANASDARVYALSLCVANSNAMCWTSSTFDRNGDELSENDGYDFDMIYLGQQALYVLDYDVGTADGAMGPRTRDALKAYQTRIGVAPTGILDIALFWRLLDSVGGPQVAADGLRAAVVEPQLAELADISFSMASEPFPKISQSAELARRADDSRRDTMATLLTLWDKPCSIPAKSATPIPEDGSGGWHVQCAEGDYTLFFDGGTRSIMTGLRAITVDGGGIVIGGSGSTETGSNPPPAKSPVGGTGRTLGH